MYQILDVRAIPSWWEALLIKYQILFVHSEAPLCGRSKEPDISDFILSRAASSSAKLWP